MNLYAELGRQVKALVEVRALGDRRAALEPILDLLNVLEVTRPAAPEALQTAYEDGALKALEIARNTRMEHEASFKTARFSAVGTILNGVENYGQALLSEAESTVSRHLTDRRRKGQDVP